MNDKTKKRKGHRSKNSDDLSQTSKVKNDIEPYLEEEDFIGQIENKRTYTKSAKHKKAKVSKVRSSSDLPQIKENEKQKKVKFADVNVINVENWKKYNLNMTAEENLEELINVSNNKKGRQKNISCTCIVF